MITQQQVTAAYDKSQRTLQDALNEKNAGDAMQVVLDNDPEKFSGTILVYNGVSLPRWRLQADRNTASKNSSDKTAQAAIEKANWEQLTLDFEKQKEEERYKNSVEISKDPNLAAIQAKKDIELTAQSLKDKRSQILLYGGIIIVGIVIIIIARKAFMSKTKPLAEA
jgi:hypothetical protein